MTDRKIDEMAEKAKKIVEQITELEKMANENDFGFEIYGDRITFEDWLSSDCYGEGNSETFGVDGAGEVWQTSSC